MITDGSSALELLLDPKRAEMEAYLSAEDGYWIQNDIWRTDSEAYRASGIKKKPARWNLGGSYKLSECIYEAGAEVLHPVLAEKPVEKPGIYTGHADDSDPPDREEHRLR